MLYIRCLNRVFCCSPLKDRSQLFSLSISHDVQVQHALSDGEMEEYARTDFYRA